MKLLHVADLHLGKSLAGQSLVEDQNDWIEKFAALVQAEKPDVVLVAGDVYDRAAPSEEAVELLDKFLTRILSVDDKVRVMMVAGNHDSGTKLQFGSDIFKKQRVHIVGRLTAELEHVTVEDESGSVVFWLLPFTFPAAIQQALGESAPRDYTSAIQALLTRQVIDPTVRNVLVAHQAVTWDGKASEYGGSEAVIGGVGNVNGEIFDVFDYVALGHIHKAQAVGRDTMRYAGSPLCYHFDEAKYHEKGAVLVTLGAKGTVDVEMKRLLPLHPIRVIEGGYEKILADERANAACGEYVKVILTDCYLSPQRSEALRALFVGKHSLALEIRSDYRTGGASSSTGGTSSSERPLDQKFIDFWKARHDNASPDAATERLIQKAVELMGMPGSSVEADAKELVEFAKEGK